MNGPSTVAKQKLGFRTQPKAPFFFFLQKKSALFYSRVVLSSPNQSRRSLFPSSIHPLSWAYAEHNLRGDIDCSKS